MYFMFLNKKKSVEPVFLRIYTEPDKMTFIGWHKSSYVSQWTAVLLRTYAFLLETNFFVWKPNKRMFLICNIKYFE